MEVKQFTVNPFSMNCYICYDKNSGEGMIIDPGVFSNDEKEMILKFIDDNKIKIKFIINTHGHIDHILGNKFAKDAFKVPLYMHKADEFLLKNAKEQSRFFGFDFPEPPPVDFYLNENSSLSINNTEFIFINTPGHSPGSVCIIDKKNKNVFCGDLVFKNSIGRTDLLGGDMNVLLDSVKNKLFAVCSDDYTLYPGHMEITTVGDEKKFNPFLRNN